MNNDQQKLWFYLKNNDPKTFHAVCEKLPRPLINAYDSQLEIFPSFSDVSRINRDIKKGGSKASNSKPKNIEKPVLPSNILSEPSIVLAYYMLIFPDELSQELDRNLSNEKRNQVVQALDIIKPRQLSKEHIDELLTFMSDSKTVLSDTPNYQKKIRLMELMVDDALQFGSLSDYFLDPKLHFVEFNEKDQDTIVMDLISNNFLTQFLAFLSKNEISPFILRLSKRQQVLIQAELEQLNVDQNSYKDIRNKVIQRIRKLQDEKKISSKIKAYLYD